MARKLSVQSIVRMGMKKIYGYFGKDIINDIRTLNNNYYTIKCVPFGFPSRWSDVKTNVIGWYDGIARFMYFCEPMIDNVDLSGNTGDSLSIRRRFRNKWDYMWSNFKEAAELSGDDAEILGDFGIRLASIDKCSIPQNVLDFYNAVISWFVLSSSGELQKEMDTDVISKISLMDGSDFVNFVSVEAWN